MYLRSVYQAIVFCILLSAFWGCKSDKQELKISPDPRISKILEKISRDSIEANVRTLVSFHTRHTISDTSSDSIGIGAARRWIYGKLKQYRRASGGQLKVKCERFVETENNHLGESTEIVNIIGMLPGRQLESKDRMYVVSAHYDSRVSDIMDDTSYAPGANDNASGTAAVMELARVMSKYEFDATIIFLAVAGKEQGLLGSSYFARKASKRNINIAGMINNDMIGNTIKSSNGSVHDDVVRVFTQGIPPNENLSKYHRQLLYTGGENDTPSRQLGRFIYRVAENHVTDLTPRIIYRSDRYFKDGDHTSFLDEGYPAVRFSELHEYYKRQQQNVRVENGVQYGDLPKFVDYEYVTKITKLNAASLAILASAPERPKKVYLDDSQFANNSTLRWKENTEPDLKAYEIVWRKTHSPYWEHSKMVGDTTTYTIKKVSKDNHLFGVRAVDQYGNKSPAVPPLLQRD